MDLRASSPTIDLFFRALEQSKENERKRGPSEALRSFEGGFLGMRLLTLRIAIALAEKDEQVATTSCLNILCNEYWGSSPRTIAEVVAALTRTLHPHDPTLLDKLLCSIQDTEKRFTYQQAVGILAGIMLGAGSPISGWASYARYGTMRTREQDESLLLALIIEFATLPTDRYNTGNASNSTMQEAERILDQAVLEYTGPDKKNVSRDSRIDHFEDVLQPPERERAIVQLWRQLCEHAKTHPLNPVGAKLMDKLSHRLLSRMPITERAELTFGIKTESSQS